MTARPGLSSMRTRSVLPGGQLKRRPAEEGLTALFGFSGLALARGLEQAAHPLLKRRVR